MNDVTNNLKCLLIRGNIEIWLEADRLDHLTTMLKGLNTQKFIEVDGSLVNSFEIAGIFTPQQMAERNLRKKGGWQCGHGKWWNKFDHECDCERRIGVWG